ANNVGFGSFAKTAALQTSKSTITDASASTNILPATQTSQSTLGPTPTPIVGEAWVRVMLSQGEWERLAKDKPARLFTLGGAGKPGKEMSAILSKILPQEDSKRSMMALYYVISGKDSGLTRNDRVRVALQ